MEKSAIGQPYQFQPPQEMRGTIDATLFPGAPEAKRKYLVKIEVGGPTQKERPDLPLPVGDNKKGFKETGLIYKKPKK